MAQDKDILAEVFGEVISSYTRAQAIANGVLIDVSEAANQLGFRVPVAMTSAAWGDCVEWSESDNCPPFHQDQASRLAEVLIAARAAARRGQGARLPFQLFRVPRGGGSLWPRLVTLHIHIGPGDQGEPVITVLMPDED